MKITDASFGVVSDGLALTITVDISERDGLTVRAYAPGEWRVSGTPDEVLAMLDGPASEVAGFVIDRVVEAMQLAVAPKVKG